MLFDFCYLGFLCGVILFTFFHVLLPLPVREVSLTLYQAKVLPHLSFDELPPELVVLFCALGLLYLKTIWRLINPPHRF